MFLFEVLAVPGYEWYIHLCFLYSNLFMRFWRCNLGLEIIEWSNLQYRISQCRKDKMTSFSYSGWIEKNCHWFQKLTIEIYVQVNDSLYLFLILRYFYEIRISPSSKIKYIWKKLMLGIDVESNNHNPESILKTRVILTAIYRRFLEYQLKV